MKRFHSFSVRLSFRFMLLLTAAVIMLSVAFVFLIRHFIRESQTAELNFASAGLAYMLENGEDIEHETMKFPYYIAYTIYETETQKILFCNDPFIPLLDVTNGQSRTYVKEDYFLDGDLNILYVANSCIKDGRHYVIQTTLNLDMDTSRQFIEMLPKAILLAIFPVLIICFLVSLFITKNTIKPVVKITKMAGTISSSHLDTLLPVSRAENEIDMLAKAFNELFSQLKKDFDRERQFTSDVSHELKTPVAVIAGQTNLLLRWGKENPGQLEKSLNIIKDETRSMQAIIDNLLQIARIENGRIKPVFEKTNLNDFFERLKQEFAVYSPDTEISYGVESGSEEAETDYELMHQVFTVIIQNSIKFTGKNCVIKLAAYTEKSRLVLEESDNGPGFEDDKIAHVFERFFRGDEAHARSAGGCGLGLSIAKTIVTALGGTVEALNTPSHGAKIRITL